MLAYNELAPMTFTKYAPITPTRIFGFVDTLSIFMDKVVERRDEDVVTDHAVLKNVGRSTENPYPLPTPRRTTMHMNFIIYSFFFFQSLNLSSSQKGGYIE
jgi:hypothetical protein